MMQRYYIQLLPSTTSLNIWIEHSLINHFSIYRTPGGPDFHNCSTTTSHEPHEQQAKLQYPGEGAAIGMEESKRFEGSTTKAEA